MHARAGAALAVLLAVAAAACGGGGGGSAGCRELREGEDPLSIQHIVDPDGYRFLTEPPTSGPHIAGPTPEGVVDQPIANAIQVRILESGHAVVQYDPASVDDTGRAALAALADHGAVVAPGVDLPAPVVATAWTWKLTCQSADDLAAIERFVTERPADAPGAD